MLQFDLQFYEEFTVAWVRTVKFISGAFFWPTGQLVSSSLHPVSVFLCSPFSLSWGVSFSLKLCYFLLCLLLF